MKPTQFFFPKFRYGYLPEYFGDGSSTPARGFALRPGQKVAIVPTLAPVTRANYLANGLTHLIVNEGQVDTSIPYANRAILEGGEFIVNELGWDYRLWTKAQIDSTVQSHLALTNGKASFFIDQTGEFLGNRFAERKVPYSIADWNASQQSRWYNAAISAVCEANLGSDYGGYDGHLNANIVLARGENNILRTALGSAANALNFAKQYSGFGNDFYINNAYTYRHGNIKIYGGGDDNFGRAITGFLCSLSVDKLARQAVNTARRVAAVVFSGYTERLDDDNAWSATYRRTVAATGGKVERDTFPQWSYSLQLFVYTMALLWDFDLFSWESAEGFGARENVINVNFNNTRYSGPAGYIQAGTSVTYNTQNVSYPLNPQGGQDIVPVSCELFTWLTSYVGNYNTAFARHKTATAAYNTVTATYLLDQYEARQGVCVLGTDAANKRWVLYCNANLMLGNTEVVTVDIGGGLTYSFNAIGQTTYAFRLDLATT